MNEFDLKARPILVIGAGIMGAGIAQVAAQAGHSVCLFDMRADAATAAKDTLAKGLSSLVAKGKLTEATVAQTLDRITAISSLQEAANASLVVEAIVEKLEAKRGLFQELEGIVSDDCVLATNTSSISVTAIANGLKHPGRLVGMHFFNPVPVMKLVEVVSGLQTDPEVATAIFKLSEKWGKVPVYARSTPGFIVNRIARPYYAETLALLETQAASPAVLDACLRAAGFRMGPCELMDLIGHDTNFSVTKSVFEANFHDKRYMPSLLQREMVDGGVLGRKSGQGFYRYGPDAEKPQPAVPDVAVLPAAQSITVKGSGPVADLIVGALHRIRGDASVAHRLPVAEIGRDSASAWVGLEIDGCQLRLTDGRCATDIGIEVVVFDLPLQSKGSTFGFEQGALAWAASARASEAWTARAAQWLQALGCMPLRLRDTPGLVVARTVAMLINEASDAVHQGVCTEQGANDAMKLGVNYPAGPFDWLATWDGDAVCRVLDALDDFYRGERYRISPGLRVSRRIAFPA